MEKEELIAETCTLAIETYDLIIKILKEIEDGKKK